MAAPVTVRFSPSGISRSGPAPPPYYWLVGDGTLPMVAGVRRDVAAPLASCVFTSFLLIYVMVALASSSVAEYRRPATFELAPGLVWLWLSLAAFVYAVFVAYAVRWRWGLVSAGGDVPAVGLWTGAVTAATFLFLGVLVVVGLATPAFEAVPWVVNASV